MVVLFSICACALFSVSVCMLQLETHVDKERVRYFHDDDNQSLHDMVKREKMGTAEDQNKLFMRMASKVMLDNIHNVLHMM